MERVLSEKETRLSNFLHGLPESIARIFSGHHLWWHLAAMAVTVLLALSGFDWNYFLYFGETATRQFLFWGVILGGIVPIVLPIVLWAWGKIRGNLRLLYSGFVLGQGAIAGYLVSIFYKSLTGRFHPVLGDPTLLDVSREFRFGFLEGGIFWGWPSSHTAVAFAMTFAIINFIPGHRRIKYAAVIYAFFVGVGVSMSIHWFSDFVAGAIFGALAGICVGKSFRIRYESKL